MRASSLVGELLYRSPMEDLSLNSGALEGESLTVAQLIEPSGEEGVNRWRNGNSRNVSHDRPTTVFRHEQTLVDQHRDHLLDEQRVTFGSFGDSLLESIVVVFLPDEVRHQLPALAVRERLEEDGRGVQLAARPGGPHLEELRSRHAHEQDRCAAGPLGEMLHQIEKQRLSPMDVVENDDERASASHRLQEPARRVEAVLGSSAPLGEADELGDPLSDEPGLRLVAHELHEPCLALLAGRRVVQLGEILDCFEQWPERDSIPVRQTAATSDECARGDVFEKIPDEPRFADAGRPENREELAGAVADRLLERVVQAPPFAVATDHRGEKATALRRRVDLRVASSSRVSPGSASRASRADVVSGSPVARRGVSRRVSAGEHRAGAHADPGRERARRHSASARRR